MKFALSIVILALSTTAFAVHTTEIQIKSLETSSRNSAEIKVIKIVDGANTCYVAYTEEKIIDSLNAKAKLSAPAVNCVKN